MCYNTDMKITRTLKITADAFYDYLEEQISKDVMNNTSLHSPSVKIEKGLKYTINKHDIHTRKEFKVLEYIRGKAYKAQIKTISDTVTITYETEEVEEGLRVTLHQVIKSFEEKKQLRIMKAFSELIYLGRMSDTLYDIQKQILSI